ncbi:malectin domain-containing carbohydrate-binding protein [Belliella sp. DSM 111904]|uniref:Malectin domain-containing carbohydrate-binding protein n=1 Tax=Belliella filtrata TaxID=2923435 RepID=A0ABS9UVC1_9BACT|nr:malectin domain-containing carbohydrate-binding protein [Belliella filtrata]MCH7408123.1 malectin domain-containing carbohydrate-binding protein [Belliella filtrata]
MLRLFHRVFIKSIFFILCLTYSAFAQEVRKAADLNGGWRSVATGLVEINEDGFEEVDFDDSQWKAVTVPHNWDQYEGYRRMKHGNKHGFAWYRKTFEVDIKDQSKQHFLFFEGVGSYATVWVNGIKVGEHAGGRTTFTLNISDAILFGKENTLAVKADHPAMIADLPWVCGGCSGEWGFSEGSQPLGIFRPVTLVVTAPVRIEPFGVHVWNDPSTDKEKAKLHIHTELKNYGDKPVTYSLVNTLIDDQGKQVKKTESKVNLKKGELRTFKQELPEIASPKLWSPENPYMYKVVTAIKHKGKIIDEMETPYGIRWISWPIGREGDDNRFFINDEPVFINGTCEYEHLIGNSHAFSEQQVRSRVDQIVAAGFNAFRDAHQPHHLKYHEEWDRRGVLFWTQFSAHIWYDTPAFRENFKTLLREWVKERRNSPSVILWGLQNESTIPKAFAEECTEIIREMDPTTSSQRLVTTCNGGEGTDWNVVQNWSGTYGGDPEKYGEELSRQILNGEYGAWRSLDLHTSGPFDQNGIYSEDRFYQLMQSKIRLAEEHKDHLAGQFQWLYNSHENPGRIQNGEGFRDIDRVGPVNYKGLVTPWEEPLDAYFMYRASYASKYSDPMVYIVSHTWPDRWHTPGVKDSLIVFSNCDEVELFNDLDGESLGKKEHPGLGKNFQWDQINIQYNVLLAKGYVDGELVAEDVIVLNHLPESPNFESFYHNDKLILGAEPGFNYLYRVNCGGPDFTDSFGHLWQADVPLSGENSWGSVSWTADFDDLPPFYASQRRTFDPIQGTRDWGLFQTFRFGRDKLKYKFPVESGTYWITFYFVEPWYGTGGSMDSKSWRVFDVGVNGKTVLKDLDIFSELGHDHALKKTVKVEVTSGEIVIDFTGVQSGQAVISGIAIASDDPNKKPSEASSKTMHSLKSSVNSENLLKINSWLDTGQPQYMDKEVAFASLPYELFGADWLQCAQSLGEEAFEGSFEVLKDSKVYVLIDSMSKEFPDWLTGYEETESMASNGEGAVFKVLVRNFKAGEPVDFGSIMGTCAAHMYSIVTVPDYQMGEGEEARPINLFQAQETMIEGEGFIEANFRNEEHIEITDDAEFSMAVKVYPGLAGTYLIRYRYMNVSDKPISVNFRIEAANGTVMRDDTLTFPVADEKWRVLNTTSGSSINAGDYKIILSGEGMKGLKIASIEFQ